MASTRTDEDLFETYFVATQDASRADEMITEHRRRYPLPDVTRSGDWTGTTQTDRDRAALEAIKRASVATDEAEKLALLDHAQGAMRATDAAVRVKR